MVPLVAAGGTVLGVVLFVVLGYLVGQSQLVAGGGHWLAGLALVEACYAALFSLPAFVLMRVALAGPAVASGPLSAPTSGGTASGTSRTAVMPACAPAPAAARARVR